MTEKQYKYKIDKNDLNQLAVLPNDKITEKQLKSLRMVALAVIIKYYSSYLSEAEDLISYACCEALERKSNYDPSFPAYNYFFTMFRNVLGNYISKRYAKEINVPDVLPLVDSQVTYQDHAVLPSCIARFKRYLTGEKEFETLSISPQQAVTLLAWIDSVTHPRHYEVPQIIRDNPEAIETLWRIATIS